MFRHRLFGIEFKPTYTLNDQTGTQAPAQAGIEDFDGISQQRLRGIVRDGPLAMFEQEVTVLCGETYRPSESSHRRAGSEMITIQTTAGKELISKRRVRESLPNGLERECVVMALAIDSEGHKHLLDFEEGSSESAEVVKGLFARLKAGGLKAGTAGFTMNCCLLLPACTRKVHHQNQRITPQHP